MRSSLFYYTSFLFLQGGTTLYINSGYWTQNSRCGLEFPSTDSSFSQPIVTTEGDSSAEQHELGRFPERISIDTYMHVITTGSPEEEAYTEQRLHSQVSC